MRFRVPAGAAGKFPSPGPAFCADGHFGIRSTAVSLQCTEKKRKKEGHFAKNGSGRLQLNTQAPYVCGCCE